MSPYQSTQEKVVVPGLGGVVEDLNLVQRASTVHENLVESFLLIWGTYYKFNWELTARNVSQSLLNRDNWSHQSYLPTLLL